MPYNSFPEGRDCTINIYRDLAMCSARNAQMRPYTELIVANLDTYSAGNQSRRQLRIAFAGLRDAAHAEPIAKRFARRAIQYIDADVQHEEAMNAYLPF